VSYVVPVKSVLDRLGETERISGGLDIEPQRLGDAVFEPVGPLEFDVTLTFTGAGIVAAGSVRGLLRTACARCLSDFETGAEGVVEAFYIERGAEEALPEEQEYEYVVDGKVDLEPALLQALVVELPFAPVHAEDCAGICPQCGADLNEGPCGCSPEPTASPFDKLKGLFPAEAESDDDEDAEV